MQYQLLTDIETITKSPMLYNNDEFSSNKAFDRRHIDDVITGVCHDSRAANNNFRLHHTSPKQNLIVVCFLQKNPTGPKNTT